METMLSISYCCHEWSGICMVWQLYWKSEGGLYRERMKNSDSGHKCWIQTLNHFSYINYCMEEGIKRQRLCLWMKQDTEVIRLVLKWLEKNNSFNLDCDKQFLVSFSTGFTSTTDDVVDTERAAESREGDADNPWRKVNGIYHAGKVQDTGLFIVQNPKVNEKKLHINSLMTNCSTNW